MQSNHAIKHLIKYYAQDLIPVSFDMIFIC